MRRGRILLNKGAVVVDSPVGKGNVKIRAEFIFSNREHVFQLFIGPQFGHTFDILYRGTVRHEYADVCPGTGGEYQQGGYTQSLCLPEDDNTEAKIIGSGKYQVYLGNQLREAVVVEKFGIDLHLRFRIDLHDLFP